MATNVAAEQVTLESTVDKLSKEVGLTRLLEQFTYEDWRDWPNSYIATRGTPTLARYYLETVEKVDPKLAKYLDASAFLFHRLYKRTKEGRIFDARLEVSKLSARGVSLETSKELLQDGVFLSFIEKLRYQFSIKYFEQNPKSRNNLRLMSVLQKEQIDESFYKSFIKVINRLSLYSTPNYRRQFFDNPALSSKLVELVSGNAASSKALASLYLVGVTDAIEKNDTAWADYLFETSRKIYPNFSLQFEVGKFLGQSLETKVVSASTDETASTGLNLFSQEKRVQTKEPQAPAKVGVSSLFIVLLIAFVTIPILVFILYKRYLEQRRFRGTIRYSDPEKDSELETVPGFDELSAGEAVNF